MAKVRPVTDIREPDTHKIGEAVARHVGGEHRLVGRLRDKHGLLARFGKVPVDGVPVALHATGEIHAYPAVLGDDDFATSVAVQVHELYVGFFPVNPRNTPELLARPELSGFVKEGRAGVRATVLDKREDSVALDIGKAGRCTWNRPVAHFRSGGQAAVPQIVLKVPFAAAVHEQAGDALAVEVNPFGGRETAGNVSNRAAVELAPFPAEREREIAERHRRKALGFHSPVGQYTMSALHDLLQKRDPAASGCVPERKRPDPVPVGKKRSRTEAVIERSGLAPETATYLESGLPVHIDIVTSRISKHEAEMEIVGRRGSRTRDLVSVEDLQQMAVRTVPAVAVAHDVAERILAAANQIGKYMSGILRVFDARFRRVAIYGQAPVRTEHAEACFTA